ncbi:MAG: hypothetical protein ACPGNV_13110 [Mangrovicoccus sp.]
MKRIHFGRWGAALLASCFFAAQTCAAATLNNSGVCTTDCIPTSEPNSVFDSSDPLQFGSKNSVSEFATLPVMDKSREIDIFRDLFEEEAAEEDDAPSPLFGLGD